MRRSRSSCRLRKARSSRKGSVHLVRRAGTRRAGGLRPSAGIRRRGGGGRHLRQRRRCREARACWPILAAAADAPLGTPAPAPPPAAGPAVDRAPRTCRLTEIPSGASVGEITERTARVSDRRARRRIVDRSRLLHRRGHDRPTGEAGADAELVAILRRALGSRDGVDISWSRL